MSALKPVMEKRSAAAADRFVLPRLLRRPARMIARLHEFETAIPRFAASIMTAVLLGSAALYGAVLGGHVSPAVQALTARTGFAIDQIRVAGHRETSEIDVLERIGLDGWTSMIGFDADAARDRIAGLPWVESASVRKIYPDAIEVHVEEREAFAVWQHGRALTLVEADGSVIAPMSGSRHAVLPLVIGMGAAERAAAFVERVERFPELAARVTAYIRVAERRWDLRLENGITVKLPEHGEEAAVAELVELDRRSGLLSRDIAGVDLRFADRLVVRLTPEAATARDAALKGARGAGNQGRRI